MNETTALVLSQLLTGEPRSGEAMARELGISRAAVWKHITTLRGLGYEICSATGAGYTLTLCPDALHAALVHRYYLPEMIGKTIISLPECGSTNAELRARAEQGAEAGLVLTADEQHTGRGRRGRTWVAARGEALLFSTLLRPLLPPSELAGLTLLAGVAVAEALRALGVETRLKWPNDVYIGGQKVCGILAELSGELDHTSYVILGIGLNVWGHPNCSQQSSTCLADHGARHSRARILAAILQSLEHNLSYLTAGKLAVVLDKWRALSNTLGREISVSTSTETFTGVARDITPEGALIVALKDGQEKVVAAGDVSIR